MLEILGKKIGMSHLFQDNGVAVPVTLLQIKNNIVIDIIEKAGKKKLLLGFDKQENTKKVSKSVAGVFQKKSQPIHKKIFESEAPKTIEVKVGDSLTVEKLLSLGSKVDVRSKSTGKGFAGSMKRWGFGGLEATHGVSISHRSHGSTGQRQDPGKVFKGKKMAGHMGCDNITKKNLEVIYLDNEKSLVGIKGCFAGKAGSDLILKLKK